MHNVSAEIQVSAKRAVPLPLRALQERLQLECDTGGPNCLRIKSVSVSPERSRPGERVYIAVTLHVERTEKKYNFYYLFCYYEGPADSIPTSCGNLPKGCGDACFAVVRRDEQEVCKEITVTGWVAPPAAGTYRFLFGTDYVDESGKAHLMDAGSVTVEVAEQPSPQDIARIVESRVERTQAKPNEPVGVYVKAHVEQSTGQYDFFAGFCYMEGPADGVETGCGRTAKGWCCGARVSQRSPCTTWADTDNWKFPVEGRYRISACAGPIVGERVVCTDVSQYWIEVAAPPQPSPSPSPWQPSPTPGPLEQIIEWLREHPWVILVALLLLLMFIFMPMMLLVAAARR
jgi:hypothetical protein